MKQTSEEAAHSFAESRSSGSAFSAYYQGIIAGAESQSEQSSWKVVANEQPPEFEDVLLSAGSLPDIFVGYFNGENFVCRCTGETIEYFRVLQWMPIP